MMAAVDPSVHISVVVPVYRGAACLEELCRRLTHALSPITPSFEIVLVEDCGPDESWKVIEELAGKDARVRGLQLSRNFGQHHAISAGLRYARGDWVVVMDCDLQDVPEAVPELYKKAQEGYDCVLARRKRRKDSASKRLSSWLFYQVFNYLTDLRYDGTVANFSIISRQVVNQLNSMPEAVRFYGGFLTWLGFSKAYVDVEHAPRFKGETSYTLAKLINMALPIIIAYSNKPLRICVAVGLTISAFSILAGTAHLIRAFLYGSAVMGWPSLMISIYFSTGAIITVLGVIALYLDSIFTEVKRRPIYVVRRSTFGG
jgi:polyisoprenyl-phosphate glycosyltransferase